MLEEKKSQDNVDYEKETVNFCCRRTALPSGVRGADFAHGSLFPSGFSREPVGAANFVSIGICSDSLHPVPLPRFSGQEKDRLALFSVSYCPPTAVQPAVQNGLLEHYVHLGRVGQCPGGTPVWDLFRLRPPDSGRSGGMGVGMLPKRPDKGIETTLTLKTLL